MTDATLIIGVKTEGATQATNDLKRIASQAGNTEKSTTKLLDTFIRFKRLLELSGIGTVVAGYLTLADTAKNL